MSEVQKSSSRRLLTWGLILVLLGLGATAAVYGMARLRGNTQDISRLPETKGGIEAFEWLDSPQIPKTPVRFEDAKGKPVSLDNFKGQVVLLNLWATWCAPCLAELPSLDRLARAYEGRGLKVLAVSVDRAGTAEPSAFFSKLDIAHLALYRDPTGRLSFTLGAPGLPASILYDRQGRELGMLAGDAVWDSAPVKEMIDRLL